MDRCTGPGPGDIARGSRTYGLGEPRPLAGDNGLGMPGPNILGEGGPLSGGGPLLFPAGRGFTGRAERQVRGATPC